MDGAVKFIAWVVKLSLVLGMAGTLKTATLATMEMAIHAQQHDQISYGKFSRMLTAPVPENMNITFLASPKKSPYSIKERFSHFISEQ